jgi:Enterobacteria phage capsid assembly protease
MSQARRTLTRRPNGAGYREELAERIRGYTHMINLAAISSGGDQRRPYQVAEGVAIIDICGALVNERWWWDESEYSQIRAEVAQALDDAEVKKILLRVNSPGGETDGAFETAAFLADAAKKKPMWAIADVMACSAGYLLACQASRLYVAPVSGRVGSIGVYALHMDFSGMLEQMGIKPTFITAGEGKTNGNPYEPLTKDAKDDIKANVDRLYGEFVRSVASARDLSEDAVVALGAYCYEGSKASIGAGLADVAGLLDDAWLALATMPDDDSPGTKNPPLLEKISAPMAGANTASTTDRPPLQQQQEANMSIRVTSDMMIEAAKKIAAEMESQRPGGNGGQARIPAATDRPAATGKCTGAHVIRAMEKLVAEMELQRPGSDRGHAQASSATQPPATQRPAATGKVTGALVISQMEKLVADMQKR